MNLQCRRVLSHAQSDKVQLKISRPCDSRPEYANAAAMIADRPKGMPKEVAEGLCAKLIDEEFVLNPNASSQWLWEKLVADTSIRHTICYMGYTEELDFIPSGMWVKACSTDLLSGSPEICRAAIRDSVDSSFVGDGLTHLEQVLSGLDHNENLWHTARLDH